MIFRRYIALMLLLCVVVGAFACNTAEPTESEEVSESVENTETEQKT